MQTLTELKDQLAELIMTNREYCIIAIGLFLIVGAWRNWEWLTSPRNIPRYSLFQQFLVECWGELAHRFFIGFGGLVVVVYGVFLLLYRHGKL